MSGPPSSGASGRTRCSPGEQREARPRTATSCRPRCWPSCGSARTTSRNGAWLEEGALIRDAGRLAGIPGVLIHGRLDMSCPLDTAWELARAWPDAELHVVGDAGHKGGGETSRLVYEAIDRFAPRG